MPPSAQFVNKANGAFLIKPDSIEDYAEKIIYLLDNPDEAKRMAEIGRDLVVRECNWEVEKTKLRDLYERLSK